tara:strand:- start:282 stop:1112 length:831 start_codon:yes stop_codon:yes gene_type:complete
MENTNGYIVTDEVITMVINNKSFTVTQAHVNFEEIKDLLTSEPPIEWEVVLELTDVAQTINTWAGSSDVSVIAGVVCYRGVAVHNAATQRILEGVAEGEDVTPFANFLSNVMKNPSMRAQRELYLFLAQSEMPITEDGHFLAYKSVREDYLDRHSATISNTVGAVCSMPRKDVDDERDNTCSYGLHFCSLPYLRGFWGFGGHTMILKINPADVVSIPSDYDNAKGRTCRYEVIGELEREDHFYGEDEKKSVFRAEESYMYGYFSKSLILGDDDIPY